MKYKKPVTSFSEDCCGETGLPVSRQVVVQHSSSYVHGVCALADNDAVVWQQLGNMMEDGVVVHGHSWLEGKALWMNRTISVSVYNIPVKLFDLN